MSKCIVGVKITISRHGQLMAIIHAKIKEGTLHDYSLETGEIELTIEIDGVREE
jgi:hypothetical protein